VGASINTKRTKLQEGEEVQDNHEKSGSAIYISDYFKTGMCYGNCETFEDHPSLSSLQHFSIKRFELWGFKDL
jgi:hypothetical protein